MQLHFVKLMAAAASAIIPATADEIDKRRPPDAPSD
jgi:hypothetical protein